MKKKLTPPPRRSGPARGRRVPRPSERALTAILEGGDWVHSKAGRGWLDALEKIADSYECDVVFDPRHDVRESCYVAQRPGVDRPLVRLGGAGASRVACLTVFAHELGHHLLRVRGQQSRDLAADELAAWDLAHEIARKHGLPVLSTVRRRALRTYRDRELRMLQPGAKGRTKPPRPPKSWRLAATRRSALASGGKGAAPTGKKGKRHAKRDLKSRAARAQRRQGIDED